MFAIRLLNVINLVFLVSFVDCAKILMLATSASRSHVNLFTPLIEKLAFRNHEITVLGYQKYPVVNSNVSILQLKSLPVFNDKDASDAFGKKVLEAANMGMVQQMLSLEKDLKEACEAILTDPATQSLITNGKQFDVVIVDSFCDECVVPLGFLLGKHIVRLSGIPWWTWKDTNVPTPLSYVPHYFERLTSKMTFWQRLNNVLVIFGMSIAVKHTVVASQQGVLNQYLPQAMTVEEAERKVAFTLTNGDPVMTSPRPSMPNVVHCGPLHCRDVRPLPAELNDFVESSGEDGFILFALGTNVPSDRLSLEFREAVLSVFSRLKQKVIWKFASKLDNAPQNVKVMSWLPQQDLLGHPKARLFISHSGLLSLQETIYHGVPVIGIPFFGDQPGNIARVEELGIGEYLNFLNVSAEGFYELINKILNDKRYYDNVRKYSAIMKDQPEKPIDRAVFWLEYLVRHDGARHFRSAGEDLNFFQYFLLDVIAFMVAVILAVLGTIWYLWKGALTLWKQRCRNATKLKQK